MCWYMNTSSKAMDLADLAEPPPSSRKRVPEAKGNAAGRQAGSESSEEDSDIELDIELDEE